MIRADRDNGPRAGAEPHRINHNRKSGGADQVRQPARAIASQMYQKGGSINAMITKPITFQSPTPELKSAIQSHILDRMASALAGLAVDLNEPDVAEAALYRLGHGQDEIAELQDRARQMAMDRRKAASK